MMLTAHNSLAVARRSATARQAYLDAALHEVPRLIASFDRNPFRASYGSCDRQYWHYRTAAFPSEMYQEAIGPLALLYTHELPGNRWYRAPRVQELILAGLAFSAQSAHSDGSCDDYYPFERALGAAVFSLNAASEACRLLDVRDTSTLAFLNRRARWIATHAESGTLANHHALAALALARVADLTNDETLRIASRRKVQQVLAWQSDEGWFEEYGGADPGYQTVTIDCLAKLRELTGDAQLDEPLSRAVRFARRFLHPDGSYAGAYGSRGTLHFYPHGCELLARQSSAAAELADGFLHALATGQAAHFADDRMYVHRLGNLIEAYRDWSSECPVSEACAKHETAYLSHAQLLIARNDESHTIAAAARGGVLTHFRAGERVTTDTGLVVETDDGRVAVSQKHELSRDIRAEIEATGSALATLTVTGPLHWTRFETATPLKQAILHLGMLTVGRFARTLVRKVLQRRLIAGRQTCPIQHSRRIEILRGSPSLRIVDTLQLLDARMQVRRLSAASDLESAYVAASGSYQSALLQPWSDLSAYLDELNTRRSVTIERTW